MERVAIVGGVRTPFVKAGGAFNGLSFQELGVGVLRALVRRLELDPSQVDQVVMGTVLLDPRTPNWAREMVFSAGFPKSVYAHSVSNNCISGLVSASTAMDAIRSGNIETAIAGGSESMSNPSLLFNRAATRKFLDLFGARTLGDRAKVVARFRPKDFLPQPPSVTEPSTGLTMGEHMELTAKEWKIARKAQDEVAFQSHSNAAKAAEFLSAEIEPLAGVEKDTIVRADTSLEKLAKLKPVFDRSANGTLTAGNSSALTDGASAIMLMSEARARREGREVVAFITDYQYAAIDPAEGLLMAPAVAVPQLLKRNGLTVADFDRVEVHEAFAAQVLANIAAWENGWKYPSIGKIDRSRLNVLGGSIALGHPFAATGGRILLSLANELKRNNLRRGLVSICAAGAMAGAMIIERDV